MEREQALDYIAMCVRLKVRKDTKGLASLRKKYGKQTDPSVVRGIEIRIARGKRILRAIRRAQAKEV